MGRYKQAMELVRRHRVDPNIIYDHRLPATIFFLINWGFVLLLSLFLFLFHAS